MIPVYVLHCAELHERTAACRSHLQERGVSAVFYRSFHGRTWGVETRLEFEPGQRLPPGHVGLNMGAFSLWQHILLAHPDDADDASYLIMEDDVELPTLFPLVLSDLQIQLNYDMPDWDLVFLGLSEVEPHVWNKVTERVGGLRSNLCRLHDPFGTHAYIVRRRALSILLDNMAVAHRNLDQQLWERVLKPGLLKWCACVPSIVRQRTFDYTGTGKPEWEASCIDPAGTPPWMTPTALAGCRLDEQDAKRLASVSVVGVPTTNESTEMVAEFQRLTDPLPCIFRGEAMNKVARLNDGRIAPLWQCGRLNQACHDKRGATSADALSCETCALRTSMPSREQRTKLPIPDGHFNPSMILYKGKLILATRDSWGHSKVALWELTNTHTDWTGEWSAEPIGSFASDHFAAPRLEDPRLFIYRDRLCAQFNLPDGYPPKRVQVGYCQFAEDLSGIDHTEVMQSPHNNLYEKNWVCAIHNDQLYWIYATKPKHVVMADDENYVTDNNLPWTGGVVRGGATPVLALRGSSVEMHRNNQDVYYHFFHGCLKRLMGNVYTMGCAVFEAKPPFRVLRQTATPLLWPDLPGPGESVVKRFVVWPGGAVPHVGAWHIALGIDDSYSKIVRIPFADVESALTDIPQVDSVTSIRDTPIAMGTQVGGT